MPKFILSVLLQSSPLCYICIFFPLILGLSVGIKSIPSFCSLIFPTITAVDNCSESVIPLVTGSASSPLENTWKLILEASWSTSFSLGRKLLPASQRKCAQTHMSRIERKALEGSGNRLQMQNPAKGSWEDSPDDAKWTLTPLPQQTFFPFVSTTGDTMFGIPEARGIKINENPPQASLEKISGLDKLTIQSPI